MKIYLVQEFSRADYDFSTDIKHHGLYVNRNEAVAKAQDVFENLKQEYADEFEKYECDDGEVEFDIDDDKGWYEFTFGVEEDFELFRVTVEEIEFDNEAYTVYRKCKKELLIEDIKGKAIEMEKISVQLQTGFKMALITMMDSGNVIGLLLDMN